MVKKEKVGPSLSEKEMKKVFSEWVPLAALGKEWGRGETGSSLLKGWATEGWLRLAWRGTCSAAGHVEVGCFVAASPVTVSSQSPVASTVNGPEPPSCSACPLPLSTSPHRWEVGSSQTWCPHDHSSPHFQIPVSFSTAYYFISPLTEGYTCTLIVTSPFLQRVLVKLRFSGKGLLLNLEVPKRLEEDFIV